MAEEDVPRRLQGVRVVGAGGLQKKDWFSKSDPYFVARVGVKGSTWFDKTFQVTSNTVKNCQDPEWNAHFTYDKENNPLAKVAAEFSSVPQEELPPLELTIQVWDEDHLKKDDFLGEAKINLPKNDELETITLPLTGKGTKGNVTVEFYTAENEEYENCTKTAMSSFNTTLEKIEAAIGGIRGSGGGSYLREVSGYIEAFGIGDPSYHWAKSEDGGLTCPSFSDGTKSILSHDLVVQELETFCQRLVSGEIYRPNNDFAFLRLNDLLWEGETPPMLLLNLAVEQHAIFRPTLDRICGVEQGNWSEDEIVEHASAFLDNLIQEMRPLRFGADVRAWACIYLHKVMLNMEIMPDEAENFDLMMSKISAIMTLPQKLAKFCDSLGIIDVEGARNFRKEKLKECMPFVLELVDKEKVSSNEDLELVTKAVLEAIMFGGGLSVPDVIYKSFATMYAVDSPKSTLCNHFEVTEDNLPQFVWEMMRYFGAVPSLPYTKDKEGNERVLITSQTAMRDPKVWGADADEFKLRDLDTYKELSTAWVDQAVHEEQPEHNHACPGKHLSLAMITGFLRAYLRRQDNFVIDKASKMHDLLSGVKIWDRTWEFKLKVPSLVEMLEEVDKGKQIQLFPEHIEEHFQNLEPHPKYKTINAATRLTHRIVQKLYQDHKNKVVDFGYKSIDEICLPKEMQELEFLELVPGGGIEVPDDDEDWESSAFKRFFVHGFQGVILALLGNATFFPIGDEPIYFDSEEEACDLVKMHFPGDSLPHPNEEIYDIESDEAICQIAFYGIGQVYLKGGKEEQTYEIDLSFMYDLEPREGYEKMGANAIFDNEMKVIKIILPSTNEEGIQDDKVSVPGDDDWPHAKWMWKTSLMLWFTLADHLSICHFTVSNIAHIAIRSKLSANHPIRRLLKVHTINAGFINSFAAQTLTPENLVLHRFSGLTLSSVRKAFSSGLASFEYNTYPEYLEAKGLDEALQDRLPLYTDALPLWDIYHRFMSSYVDFYYSEEEVNSDQELQDFWECVDKRGDRGFPDRYGLPPLSKASLIDYLTHVAFFVTAWHEHNGAVIQYFLPMTKNGDRAPSRGMGLGKVRSGKQEKSVQQVVGELTLLGGTGLRNPMIMSNWKHLLRKDPEVHRLHDQLIEELREHSERVDALNDAAPNERRPRKCETFNPKYLECSVSY